MDALNEDWLNPFNNPYTRANVSRETFEHTTRENLRTHTFKFAYVDNTDYISKVMPGKNNRSIHGECLVQ